MRSYFVYFALTSCLQKVIIQTCVTFFIILKLRRNCSDVKGKTNINLKPKTESELSTEAGSAHEKFLNKYADKINRHNGTGT